MKTTAVTGRPGNQQRGIETFGENNTGVMLTTEKTREVTKKTEPSPPEEAVQNQSQFIATGTQPPVVSLKPKTVTKQTEVLPQDTPRDDSLVSGNQRMSSVSQRTFGQSVEEELENMFTGSDRTQKTFTINGSKVAVIFNPKGAAIQIGFMSLSDPVSIVSDKAIPASVVQKIVAKIPPKYTYSTLSMGTINGLTPFQALGLA